MKYIDLPDQEIIDLYNNKLSITKIAKIYNVSRETISLRLKKNNINIRPLGSHNRKYDLNEHYFDEILNEDQAYFLGFLYSDGCNHLKVGKVSLCLQEDDKEILSKLSYYLYNAEFLSFIKGRNGSKNQYGLKICSKHICNKLNELGCTPKKSLNLKFPLWMHDNLKKHFIRGYFDGDGSISSSTRKYKNLDTTGIDFKWSIVSTDSFCSDLINFINSEIDIHFSTKLTCKESNLITTTVYTHGNKQILKLMEWLYQDSNIYLARKHNKYLELKQLYNK